MDKFITPAEKGQTSRGQGGGGTHGFTCGFLHPASPSVPGEEEGVLCFFQNKIVKPVSCPALMYSAFFEKTLYLGSSRKLHFQDNIVTVIAQNVGRNPDF